MTRPRATNDVLDSAHYLGSKGARARFVVELPGCIMTFSGPSSRRLPSDWLELSRWCILEGTGSKHWKDALLQLQRERERERVKRLRSSATLIPPLVTQVLCIGRATGTGRRRGTSYDPRRRGPEQEEGNDKQRNIAGFSCCALTTVAKKPWHYATRLSFDDSPSPSTVNRNGKTVDLSIQVERTLTSSGST